MKSVFAAINLCGDCEGGAMAMIAPIHAEKPSYFSVR